MEDQLIVNLFFERSEKAISELANKYGKRCKALAVRILENEEDAEECVNDAYLAAWNNIPPEHPTFLGAYVARITRNLSLSKVRADLALKRKSEYDVCVEELEEVLRSKENVEDAILTGELKGAINHFLEKQEKTDRIIFVNRYWFCKNANEIAKEIGQSTNYVNVRLHRLKERLQKYLKAEELIG
ncbi:MAG: sigma-70 family RNA polymerase sigma factor [Lachnospiraceae bacterium]|nr:sigma-70 family RNA polymerase sigma factor [Lachnospiraceae bacterium]